MIAEGMIEAALGVPLEERQRTFEKCLRAMVLRSFHESWAFGSMALTAWPSEVADLEFVLVDKDGYAPEHWLFKARRYLRFSRLEAGITFGCKGNIHSGWVRARLDMEKEFGVSLTIDAGQAVGMDAGAFEARILESGGELFDVRVRAGTGAGTGEGSARGSV